MKPFGSGRSSPLILHLCKVFNASKDFELLAAALFGFSLAAGIDSLALGVLAAGADVLGSLAAAAGVSGTLFAGADCLESLVAGGAGLESLGACAVFLGLHAVRLEASLVVSFAFLHSGSEVFP